jgi:hypothetical protein
MFEVPAVTDSCRVGEVDTVTEAAADTTDAGHTERNVELDSELQNSLPASSGSHQPVTSGDTPNVCDAVSQDSCLSSSNADSPIVCDKPHDKIKNSDVDLEATDGKHDNLGVTESQVFVESLSGTVIFDEQFNVIVPEDSRQLENTELVNADSLSLRVEVGDVVETTSGGALTETMVDGDVVVLVQGGSVVRAMPGEDVVQVMSCEGTIDTSPGRDVVELMPDEHMIKAIPAGGVARVMPGEDVVNTMPVDDVVQATSCGGTVDSRPDQAVVKVMPGGGVVDSVLGEGMIKAIPVGVVIETTPGGVVEAPPDTPTSSTRHRFASRGTLMLERAKQLTLGNSPAASAIMGNSSSPTTGVVIRPDDVTSNTATLAQRFLPPAASPSAGILRKRTLARVDVSTESPSPPNKHRRVCFSDQIETHEIPSRRRISRLLNGAKPWTNDDLVAVGNPRRTPPPTSSGAGSSQKPSQVLVSDGQLRPVSRQLELSAGQSIGVKGRSQLRSPATGLSRFISGVGSTSQHRLIAIEPAKVSSPGAIIESPASASDVNDLNTVAGDREDDEVEPEVVGVDDGMRTSGDGNLLKPLSLQLTPESQLDSTQPIYADLMDSAQPVTVILNHLTTTPWVAALEKYLKSMNVLTIGDLSSLTEQEIHHLPIAQPKVANVRRALRTLVTECQPNSDEEPAAVSALVDDVDECHDMPLPAPPSDQQTNYLHCIELASQLEAHIAQLASQMSNADKFKLAALVQKAILPLYVD